MTGWDKYWSWYPDTPGQYPDSKWAWCGPLKLVVHVNEFKKASNRKNVADNRHPFGKFFCHIFLFLVFTFSFSLVVSRVLTTNESRLPPIVDAYLIARRVGVHHSVSVSTVLIPTSYYFSRKPLSFIH